MTTLSNLFSYGQLSVRKAHHNAYEKMHPVENPMPLVDPQTLLGIEIEVENITQYMDFNHYWSQKEDNSLRNNGREFVSIPLRAYQVEYALNHLERVFSACDVKPVFSSRCSVHIHMNVRDFTTEQLQVFFLLYRLFEKHFFHIAGAKRESNIFCVPLYKTDPSALKSDNIFTAMGGWHKYYALNIGTVSGNADVAKYGTVEFRHLYGTLDRKILMDWINSILCLHKASKLYTVQQLLTKIESLNTTSEYYSMYNTIFGEYTLNTQMSKYDFESCVSHVKIAEFGTHWLKITTGSRFYNKVHAYRQEQKEAQANKADMIQKLAKQINWDVVKEKTNIPNKVIKLTISNDKTHFVTPQGHIYYHLRDDMPVSPELYLIQCGVYSGHYKILKDMNTGRRYIAMPPEDIELFKLNTAVHCKHLIKYKQQNVTVATIDGIATNYITIPNPEQNWFVDNGV